MIIFISKADIFDSSAESKYYNHGIVILVGKVVHSITHRTLYNLVMQVHLVKKVKFSWLTMSACPSRHSVWNLSCRSSEGRSLNPVYFTWNKRHNPKTFSLYDTVHWMNLYELPQVRHKKHIKFLTSHSLLNFLNSSSFSNEDLWSGTTLGIVLKLLFPTSQHNVFATNESMLSEVTSFITTSQQYPRCDEILRKILIG